MSSVEVRPGRVALYDFIATLIRTDFKGRYHGTIGGFLWAIAKPLATFLVLHRTFTFIFPDKKYPLYLIVGLLLWNFFPETTTAGMESLVRKGFLVTKARFPRWIVVVTSTANGALTLLVYATAIVVVIALSRGFPRIPNLLLFAWYLTQYFAIVVGFSLATSVLYPTYRDLNQVWDVMLQAGFFLAPIMYPIDAIPEQYHILLYLWPVTPIVQFSRAVLIDGTIPTLKAHLLLLAVTVTILGTGAMIFKRHVTRAIERL